MVSPKKVHVQTTWNFTLQKIAQAVIILVSHRTCVTTEWWYHFVTFWPGVGIYFLTDIWDWVKKFWLFNISNFFTKKNISLRSPPPPPPRHKKMTFPLCLFWHVLEHLENLKLHTCSLCNLSLPPGLKLRLLELRDFSESLLLLFCLSRFPYRSRYRFNSESIFAKRPSRRLAALARSSSARFAWNSWSSISFKPTRRS
jgi:hypothetical protein